MFIKEASEEILLFYSLIHLPITQYNMSLLCVVVICTIDPIYQVTFCCMLPIFIQSYMQHVFNSHNSQLVIHNLELVPNLQNEIKIIIELVDGEGKSSFFS